MIQLITKTSQFVPKSNLMDCSVERRLGVIASNPPNTHRFLRVTGKAENVEDDMTYSIQILRRIVLSCSAFILPECNIDTQCRPFSIDQCARRHARKESAVMSDIL